jgi:hypothetical protein
MKRKNVVKILLVVVLVFGVLSGVLPRFAQATEASSPDPVNWYLREQDVGIQLIGNADNVGRSVFCVTADDCKIVYFDHTNDDLKFFDCDDSSCSTGTITTVDSTGYVGEELSVYCLSSTDCKIAYFDTTNAALIFYDCDDSACARGTKTVLDGNLGCSLTGGTGCSATRYAGHYPVVFLA